MAKFSPSQRIKKKGTQGEGKSHDFGYFIIVFSPHDMEIELLVIKIEETSVSRLKDIPFFAYFSYL